MMPVPILTLYTVRNSDGCYLPSRDNSWSWWTPLDSARIYSDAKPARAMVTRMTRVRPDAAPYSLIALHVTAAEAVPEQCRVASAVKTIDDRKLESERAGRLFDLDRAHERLAQARELVRELESEER